MYKNYNIYAKNIEKLIKEVFQIDNIVYLIIALVIGILLGIAIGINYRKRISEAKIGVAEERAEKIVEEATREAESKKK